jgi:hypothetical protein
MQFGERRRAAGIALPLPLDLGPRGATGPEALSNIELSRRRPEALCVIVFGRATAMPVHLTADGRDSMRLATPPANCKKSIQYTNSNCPAKSWWLSSMNSIGSAHAGLVRPSLKILLVSTPDRILFIFGSYSGWP